MSYPVLEIGDEVVFNLEGESIQGKIIEFFERGKLVEVEYLIDKGLERVEVFREEIVAKKIGKRQWNMDFR